ncbi:MAG: SCO family protein [Halioglobus sp.]
MDSAKAKLLLSFATVNLALVIVVGSVWLNKPAAPPLIQGVLLPEARELDTFALVDHRNQTFSNRNLLGRWHLVSYGFTTCPDVCPTTLVTLAALADKIEAENREPLNVLFYTVDHRRDTAEQIASYLPFFHREFLGLTHVDDSNNPHLPFEQGLGIHARLTPSPGITTDANDYQVSHGVTLLLINPMGQLQAVFKPGEDEQGNQVFDPQQLYTDYLLVRDYVNQPQIAALSTAFSSAP